MHSAVIESAADTGAIQKATTSPSSPPSGKPIKVSQSPSLEPSRDSKAEVSSPDQISSRQVETFATEGQDAKTAAKPGIGMELIKRGDMKLGSSGSASGVLHAVDSQAVQQAAGELLTFLEDHRPEGTEPYAADVLAHMTRIAEVLVRHGITSPGALADEQVKALAHDTWAAIAKAPFQTMGYSIGLPIHALIGTKAMTAADPSLRFAFVGATTVAATNFSYTVTDPATEHWFAVGPEAEMPETIQNRKSPEQKTIERAVRTLLLDALRQLIPAGAVGHAWFRGQQTVVSNDANFISVVSDALSRNVIPLVNTPLEVTSDVTGSSHAERFYLQSPKRLDAWLTASKNKSVASTLKPTWSGAGKTGRGLATGAANWVRQLPMNAALFLTGLLFISVGVAAMTGRASEIASHHPPLPSGMETARSAFERRAIFSWGIETPLEFTLVLGQMVAAKSGTDIWGALQFMVLGLAQCCGMTGMRSRQRAAA